MKHLPVEAKEALRKRKRDDQRRHRAKLKETAGIRKKRRVRQDKKRSDRKYYARKVLTTPTKILNRYRKVLSHLSVHLINFIGKEYEGNIDDYQKSHNRRRWKWGGKANSWDIERKTVDNVIEIVSLQRKYEFKHARDFTKSLNVVCDGEKHIMQIPVEGKKIEMADSAILIQGRSLYYRACYDYEACSESCGLTLINVKAGGEFTYAPEQVNDILRTYDLKINNTL